MQQKKIAAIITKVKKVRDDNGLTCQAIYDIVQKKWIRCEFIHDQAHL